MSEADRLASHPAGAASRLRHALAIIAGLYGASGVGLLAAGTHMPAGAWLTTAGTMLLFHAPVLLALRLWPRAPGAADRARALSAADRIADVAALLLAAGVGLFAGDLVARVFLGQGLFPMAAPTGGTVTMVGWLVLTLFLAVSGRR